jgi:hypothetical protein
LAFQGSHAGSIESVAFGYNGSVHAKVAELVDALDLGSSGATRESSSLSFRTIRKPGVLIARCLRVFYFLLRARAC